MKTVKLCFTKTFVREHKKRFGLTKSIMIKKMVDTIAKNEHYDKKEALSCRYSIYKNIYKQAIAQRASLFKKMKLEKKIKKLDFKGERK